MAVRPHWLFGDQLGPHFIDHRHQGPDPRAPLIMIESWAVLRRRRFHRAKAHLLLSAMRHRAAELGDRVRYVRARTYREGLAEAAGREPVTVCRPTSHAALGLVESLAQVHVLPARGFLTPGDAFATWAEQRAPGRMRMEDFYRWVRREHELLMDGDQPMRRSLEPGPGEPGAPAPRRPHPRSTRPVAPRGGRDRRRGPARSGPLGARGPGVLRRTRRPTVLPRHPPGGTGIPAPLHRTPAAVVRPVRGRDARGGSRAEPQPALGTVEPRAAAPGRVRGPGRAGVARRPTRP